MRAPARFLAAALVAAGLAGATAAPARAQDDWDVKRDPFDRQVIARYKRILAKDPGDRDALNKLRNLYKRHRTIALLVSEYEKELARKPADFALLVVLGHLEIGEGRKAEALAYYEKAAAARPDDPALATALGDLYRGAGELDKARAAFDRALAKTGDRKGKKQLLRALADLALDKNDIASAKKYFQKSIENDPADVQIRLDLADALTRHKLYDEAVASLRTAEDKLKSDPAQRVDVIARIGQTYESAGKDADAIREYRRAMGLVQRGYYLRKELIERIVEIHRRKQDLPALLTRFEGEWKVAGRDHFEWDVLARLYEETGAQEKALDAYKKAVAKAPFELETQRRLIAMYENAGRDADALRQYEAVIKIAPGEPRFQLELAERYWRKGDEKKALAMLKQLEGRFAGDAGVHSALADLYTRWGKEELALKSYERLTSIEPEELSHLVNLGDQYFQRGDKKKALAVWKRILGQKGATGFAKLGEVYAEHDMPNEALEMYGKAIKLKPKETELYKGRARVFERQKRWNEAVTDWEKALSLLPTGKAHRPARRDIRREVVGLLKKAGGSALGSRIDQWEKAFAKKPPDLEAGYYLAEAHLRNVQNKSARAVLEKILAIEPDDLDATETLVKVYRGQREFDKAVALLEKLATASPGREREYYNQIAEIKTDQHKDTEAIEYAQKALAKSPKDPLAYHQLGERYEAMQQYERAITAYEKTIELDPRQYRAYFALARLYRNASRLEKAAALYREVITRATDEDVLDRAGDEAVDLEELTGTLGELERVIAPLAFTMAHKDIYRRKLVQLYERYVPVLVARWHRGDAAVKKAAQVELERLGAHGLKPLLEALSDDKDSSQQRIAVAVLGYLGNRGAAGPLVRLARQSTAAAPQGAPLPTSPRARIGTLVPNEGWELRVEALVGAGRLGDPRTIPDLVELANHSEVAMREAATFALGMTGDKRALAPLLRALDDRRDSVQTLACLGLARLGDRKAAPQLIGVVRDLQRRDETRAACAFALGVAGDARAVPALGEALADGQGELQRLAAWSLGRLGDRRALPALFGAYFAKRDRVRAAIAWALPRVAAGQTGGDDAVRYLDYPMRSGKLDVRAAVAQLAPQSGDPPLSPMLLVGRETDLGNAVRAALGRHRDALVRVLEDLDSRDGGVGLGPLTARLAAAPARDRAQVIAVLDKLGSALLPDLEKLASHRDPQVRRRALSVAGKVAAPASRALIERGLTDAELSVREGAMLAAAHYAARGGAKASELVRRVIEKLTSPMWQERVAAARALGEMGAAADRAVLARAASTDEKAFVREAAVVAVGRLGGQGSLDVLLRAADHTQEKVPEVRLAAVQALARSSDPRARGALPGIAAADPSDEVRRAAGRSEKK
jgi:tetratricopeptide (TPR) repeat protein/HEAT repeat protein